MKYPTLKLSNTANIEDIKSNIALLKAFNEKLRADNLILKNSINN